ncbi:MAG: polysaccharide export protein [Ancalomicrobiaceae bacterium]|nr:polysaccharide export protein [Ancalomicrobiaceae bacterium]
MFARLCVLLLVVGLTACAATVRPAPVHEELTEPYRFDSGDKLRITVFDQPGLNQVYMVDQAGYVTFPLVGPVAARGATSQDLARQLARKLESGYLKHPDVSVEVDTYRPIFVMGEIKNAGQYNYVAGMTVQNAVAIAGGFTPRAIISDADITRQLNGQVMSGRVPLTDPIRPGDTINIRERFF